MDDLGAAKGVVRAMLADLEAGGAGAAARALARHAGPDWRWRGVHPFHERLGPEAVAEAFWGPLLGAFGALQARPQVLLAGRNALDGGETVWVATMGHLLGVFRAPWLGIPPTGRLALLRWAQFDRVEGGRVARTALLCDIPWLMAQAGRDPFPPGTGAAVGWPGPRTQDGVMEGPRDAAEGEATRRLIGRMMDVMEGREPGGGDYADDLRRTWAEDMAWWGPHGIGASFTIPGYLAGHALPFPSASRGDCLYHRDECLIAEGRFGAFFGWGNMSLRNPGGFLGMPAHPDLVPMTAVDVYRREDDRLAENWVFVDLLDWLRRQGLDVLGRMRGLPGA